MRAETGSEHSTVKRVADQLGYGMESARLWARRPDNDDGHAPAVSSSEAARVRELEQEVRKLRRAKARALRSALGGQADDAAVLTATLRAP